MMTARLGSKLRGQKEKLHFPHWQVLTICASTVTVPGDRHCEPGAVGVGTPGLGGPQGHSCRRSSASPVGPVAIMSIDAAALAGSGS